MALVSPHSQLPGGCGLGSGDLVLLFKKEGQWEEASIPRLRNWGEGRRMVPRVLNKAHTEEESDLVRKQADVGRVSHSGKGLRSSMATVVTKNKDCVGMPRTSSDQPLKNNNQLHRERAHRLVVQY